MNQPLLGFHYDIARGTYLKPQIFERALRLAASAGYTHFLPYLENMIRLASMARACPSCAYTPEQWQRFEQVAREAGIELVPHFNVIGHTELICPAYPELGGEADRGHLDIDPERKVTQQWTRNCLAEFCEFSRSKYFLIGGDEWQPPQHLLARSDFDTARAWVDQVNLAVAFLAKQGRRPLVWHDMLVHFPSALANLSRDAVIAFWFYDEDSDYPVLGTFRDLGFETWMASSVLAHPARLSRRSRNGLRCAARAVDRHRADGLLVTTWGDCRWELQSLNIPLAARILRGEEPPAPLLEALTLADLLQKLPPVSPLTEEVTERIRCALEDPVWDEYPDARAVTRAGLDGDRVADLTSYEQFHYPQGPVYSQIRQGWPVADWSAPAPAVRAPAESGFGLRVAEDPRAGPVLRFHNEPETFAVYPRYGGSLQDWLHGDRIVIPGTMAQFLQRERLPGGYRSYSAAGGLRPIWALGTHSNPCILWQYPYEWQVAEETCDRVAVELRRDFPHATIALRIAMARGRSGFAYESRAINKLNHAPGAFSFNLPLAFAEADLAGLRFHWNDERGEQETTVAREGATVFSLPARGDLVLRGTAWTLRIRADSARTALYFVDWGPGWITPDLHGVYRPLPLGEETVTRWHFSLEV